MSFVDTVNQRKSLHNPWYGRDSFSLPLTHAFFIHSTILPQLGTISCNLEKNSLINTWGKAEWRKEQRNLSGAMIIPYLKSTLSLNFLLLEIINFLIVEDSSNQLVSTKSVLMHQPNRKLKILAGISLPQSLYKGGLNQYKGCPAATLVIIQRTVEENPWVDYWQTGAGAITFYFSYSHFRCEKR